MRFGSYEVDEKPLGQGAMGVVYKARHLVLGTAACIKVLQGELTRRPDVVQRFVNEAIAAAGLKHDHIVGVSDCAQTAEGTWYIVLEYLEGLSLGKWLKGDTRHGVALRVTAANGAGAVDLAQVVLILVQVADALHAAHEAGIVHRDVKPDNIMLVDRRVGGRDNDLHVVVVDFGIAKLRSPDGVDLTKSTAYLGTPAYMAPEQFGSAKYADARTDVYALGGILFKMITGGFYPWADANNEIGSTEQLYHRQVTEPPPDPRARNPAVAPGLADLTRWALACDPRDRCPSARVFAQTLVKAAGDAGVSVADLARAQSVSLELWSAGDASARAASEAPASDANDDLVWRPPPSAVSSGVPREIVARPDEPTRPLKPAPPDPFESTLGSAAAQSVPPPVAAIAPVSVGGSHRRRLLLGAVVGAAAASLLVAAVFALQAGGSKPRRSASMGAIDRVDAAASGTQEQDAGDTAAGATSPPAIRDGAAEPSKAIANLTAVAVLTQPDGAAVFIDDELVGTAPAKVSLAPGRSIRVRAELVGRASAETTHTVGSKPETVRLTLAPVPTTPPPIVTRSPTAPRGGGPARPGERVKPPAPPPAEPPPAEPPTTGRGFDPERIGN
jgi:serine/threonine-protein kinase